MTMACAQLTQKKCMKELQLTMLKADVLELRESGAGIQNVNNNVVFTITIHVGAFYV